MTNIEKNIKIKETYAATMLKRTSQICRVFTCKVQYNHLNKQQRQQLKMMFVEAKWMYSYVLNVDIRKTVTFMQRKIWFGFIKIYRMRNTYKILLKLKTN